MFSKAMHRIFLVQTSTFYVYIFIERYGRVENMSNNLSESYAKVLEKWEGMTITSDPMFGMVMQNK